MQTAGRRSNAGEQPAGDVFLKETPAGHLLSEGEQARDRDLMLRQVGRGLKAVFPVDEGGVDVGLKDALGRCLRSIERAQPTRR